ncbi:MAG TPA: hypothetical protein VGS20_10170 [Candidatus Acidoferrales bacterium]|nr:hypothetical protein [Candidatus Acidoferrales bacterium]
MNERPLNFEVQPTEHQRRLWPLLAAGAGIVVLLLVAFNWAARRSARRAPELAPLPFGPAEQAYAPHLRFQNLDVKRFGNMFDQTVTYLYGQVVNDGDSQVLDVQVAVEFRNARNEVVLRQTVRALGPRPAPLAPGDSRDFQLGFEQIPDDWNMQYPSVRVTGLLLH